MDVTFPLSALYHALSICVNRQSSQIYLRKYVFYAYCYICADMLYYNHSKGEAKQCFTTDDQKRLIETPKGIETQEIVAPANQQGGQHNEH